MILVAVCDDEKCILEEISEYLHSMQGEVSDKLEIHCFQNAEYFLAEIQDGFSYHIVFLDIKLGEENGICVAKKIREKYPATVIIFITGYCQYVYEVFEVQPLGFIRKPLLKEEVRHNFKRAVKQCDILPVLEYYHGGGLHRILLKDICYIESDKRKIRLRTSHGEEAYYGKLSDVEEKLSSFNANFIRISQSVIINMNYVSKIDYRTVELGNNGCTWLFNISQTYRVQVRKQYRDSMKVY